MPYADPNDPRRLVTVYAWSAANPEKVKAAKKKYADNNQEAVRQRITNWREVNKERMKAARKAWRDANKHKSQAYVRKRQAAQKKRVPNWVTRDDFWLMEEVYELAVLRTKMFGFRWDVDHILPLQGKTVSGLHVPLNLQVIPSVVNSSKGARV
jgi:hypothetical protein